MVAHEVMVQARIGPLEPALPLRLIIQRKTPEASEGTRKKLHSAASRKQKTLDPRSLVAAEFIILGTSLPAEAYPHCQPKPIRPRRCSACIACAGRSNWHSSG